MNIKFEKKKENAGGHTTHTGRGNLGAAALDNEAGSWRRGGTQRRGWRRGGVQWRPPGAAKTRACARSGGRGGEAEVARGRGRDGGRQRRRRSQGLWAATSTAAVLGELERWGEQGNGRREGGRAKEGGS